MFAGVVVLAVFELDGATQAPKLKVKVAKRHTLAARKIFFIL